MLESFLYEVDDDKIIKYRDKEGESQKMPAGSAKKLPKDHPAKIAYDTMTKYDDYQDKKDKGKKLGKGDFDTTGGMADEPPYQRDRDKEAEDDFYDNRPEIDRYSDDNPFSNDPDVEDYEDYEKYKDYDVLGGYKNDDKLYNDLYDFMFQEKYMYQHYYEIGDIVLSDQILSLHKRDQNDPELLKDRVLHRITFRLSNTGKPTWCEKYNNIDVINSENEGVKYA